MAKERIYSITSVDAQGDNTTVTIIAEGQTNTGGWTNSELISRGAPINGNYEYDFIAEPPSGPSTDVLTDISVTLDIPNTADIRTIRVYSSTNDMIWAAP